MPVKPEDYLLLMFSMKGVGKRVDFNHIKEKISRDLKKFSDEEIKKILENLIKQELLEEVKGLYGVTKRGMEYFSKRMKEIEQELRKVNEPWVIVYKAKQYYPSVLNTVFEFCKDRYTGFYCLDPQTPILTPSGFVPISNIKIGDKVYALSSNDFKPCLVTNTFCRNVKEEVLIIKPYYLHPILITKNHPILVRYGYYKHPTLPRICKICGKVVERKRTNYCLECSEKRRKEYRKKYLKWYFGISQEDPRRKRESFGLGKREFIKLLSNPEWVSAEELYKRWLIHKKETSVWKKLIPHLAFPIPQTVKDVPKLTFQHCEFLGYYAAEGYTLPNCVTIEVSAKAKLLAERIYELCEKLFPNAHLYERIDKRDGSRYLRISINSKKTAEFIRKLCSGNARTKEFHPSIMWLPPEKQMTLLEAFLRGDGCVTQTKGFTTINYGSTTSLSLALQLQLMLFRNKIFAGITSEAIFSGRGPGRCYFLNYYNPNAIFGRFSIFEKNVLWVPIFSIRTHKYEGEVCNLEVQNAQNYLTSAGLVHNCLFTEKRFFRRDFRGKKIVLKSPKDLLFFISIHYIDVIPCVHRIGMNRPDWLVVDIDPGPKVSWEKTKEVAEITYKIFEKLSLNPAIKFSGSRGFQVWSLIKEFEIPEFYQPLTLRGGSKRERNYFTLFSDFVRIIQKEVDKEIPKITTSETLSKEEREDKILLDSASMKPLGLVRAPYSVHSKSGLVSLPLNIKELKDFEPKDASTEKVLERYEKKGNEFILKEADPSKLLNLFKD
jgi:DNA primase